ncbi:MAG TPA: ATP-binding protein, partial [Noviherbaspirillum sp.]
FRPIGLRLVRIIVMVALCCAGGAIALQTLYAIRNERSAFDARIHEITVTRLPMLSSALWDIDPRLAQTQINSIVAMPQVDSAFLVTAAGINLHAGDRTAQARSDTADARLDIMPPGGTGNSLGHLYILFDHDYLLRQVLIDIALTTTFTGLFAALLCVLLIRFLRVEVSIPLQRLLSHVNTLSPDALGIPYSSGRPMRAWRDELDQLAEGFALLHSSIARYVDERNRAEAALAQERDQLEVKVAERTQDLEAARDKADLASRTKSEFLANMSHEIRTPINAITGFTTLALRTTLSPKQSDYLQKIQNAAQGLLRIINDLLDFSKIEAGHLDMERIPFRLHDVIDTTIAYISIPAQNKGLAVRVRVGSEVSQRWIGDPLRLGQVLTNLCSNAVKFTEQGEVEVRVELASAVAQSARLLFSVRDTGIGLTPEQAGKLFQAFIQADTSITRKFGGTGLGLAISQRLVGMMNGRIWLESQPGVGTTFFFEVELGVDHEEFSTDCTSAHIATAGSPSLHLAGARLLVVEDNPINRQLARELLEQEGAEVWMAENGRVALESLQSFDAGHFDAVLLDLQMPEMDGYQTAVRIRQLPMGMHPPLIAMTAHATEEEREHCLAAGMQDHLTKPIDPQLMASTLLRWIDREKLESRAAPAPRTHTADTPANWPATLAGIDISAALKRCGNDSALMRNLLLQFHHHYADAAVQLRQLCAQGDFSEAKSLVHSIKGAAANLAMRELAEAASMLERSLNEELVKQ